MTGLTAIYRRSGADLPGMDPRPSHGAEMEGYFWRCTDVEHQRVVVALCGVNRSPVGTWATVAVAVDPGGFVQAVAAPTAWADPHRYRVVVPGILQADESRLRVNLEPETVIDLALDPGPGWPLRAGGGGLFSALPFLGQYWHPHVLDGCASGTVAAGDQRWSLSRAQLYAEKNWGRGFPEFWWWGQAQGFERPDVCVAFSGGRLQAGPVGVVVGGVIVKVGDTVIRLTPPLARIKTDVQPGRWMMAARGRGYRVVVNGEADPGAAHVLPVPVPADRRNEDCDWEYLRGRLSLEVDGPKVSYAGTSSLAGLEVGVRPA